MIDYYSLSCNWLVNGFDRNLGPINSYWTVYKQVSTVRLFCADFSDIDPRRFDQQTLTSLLNIIFNRSCRCGFIDSPGDEGRQIIDAIRS